MKRIVGIFILCLLLTGALYFLLHTMGFRDLWHAVILNFATSGVFAFWAAGRIAFATLVFFVLAFLANAAPIIGIALRFFE